MPELPEVEVVKQTLLANVSNRTITNIRIYWNSIIKEPELQQFKKQLQGQKINDVQRIAKHLIFVLDRDVLISHLRMEGKYYFQKKAEDIEWKHVLLVLELDNEYELRYHDTRRFGTFHLQDLKNYQEKLPIVKVGPEPFAKGATVEYLFQKLSNKKRAIKTMLLDQTIISGLGNIYVDEVLYASKIHPETLCNRLNYDSITKVLKYAKSILNQAIKFKGTTIASYTSNVGVIGEYQKFLKVHMRQHQQCYGCTTKISKIKLNGRGTYFCSTCQIKL